MNGKRLGEKNLSFVDVWAIAFGCIVGWGSLVMPGTTFLPIAGPMGTVIAMAVSTVLMLIIGRNHSYLMTVRPGEGGIYTYTKDAFGRDHAFLCAWFLIISYLTVVFMNATALFVVARTMFDKLFQFGFHYKIADYDIYFGEILLSAIALVLIGTVFIIKSSILKRIHTVLAFIMITGVVILCVFAAMNFEPSDLKPAFMSGESGGAFTGIMTIILLSPWAFVGFDIVTLETPRFKFNIKKSRAVVTLSIICGGFMYTALTLIAITSRPAGLNNWYDYVSKLDNITGTIAVPTFFASQHNAGTFGIVVITLVALGATLTGIIAAYRATARMLTTMARDKILTQGFLKKPICIVFIMLISIVFSFFGRNALDWFVQMTSFGAVVGFGYVSASAWKFARKEKNIKIQITGFIGTGVSIVFAFAHLASKVVDVETMCAESFLLLAVWCLIGSLFYWRTMRRSELSDFKGVATVTTVLFCLVVYSTILWFIKSIPENCAPSELPSITIHRSVVLIAFIFVAVVIMLYIQGALRRRHQKLEREMIRAEESNKAKSRFLFSITHDIRTPMNAILGYTHLIKQEKNVPDQIIDYTDKIDESGKHLLSLIDNILEMSRIEYGTLELKPEKANMRATVMTAYEMLKPSMDEKKINYTLNDSEISDEWTYFDVHHVTRVILNLLSNAYKFTKTGGKVSLTAKSTVIGSRVDYEIHVKDNGIGMSKEFVRNVFEAFSRERSSTVSQIQGTGLGMAISKTIVEKMGGDIKVYTEQDKGTEFVIKLSFELCEAPFEDKSESGGNEVRVDFTGKRLLLAEDMVVNQKLARKMLEPLGVSVDVAENGIEAIKLLEANGGDYDAVLMDIQMPVMDGYEAARNIRKNKNPKIAGIPIIAVTANAFEEDVKRAEEAGIERYISKPVDPDKLREIFTTLFPITP